MRKLVNDVRGMIDLTIVLMIGVAFAALMVVAYIIFKIKDQLVFPYSASPSSSHLRWENLSANLTGGFDNAVNLLLVAITILILAVAIGSLLMLRGR